MVLAGVLALAAFAKEGLAQAPPADDKPGPAAVSTPLFVLSAGAEGGARGSVFLGRPEGSDSLNTIEDSVQGLLAREIVRQAVLIAARDELGLIARDEVLGDEPPPAPRGAGAEVVTDLRKEGGKSRMFVRKGGGENIETLLMRNLGENGAAEVGYLAKLVALTETFTRAEIPAALKSLGFKGSPNKYRADAPLPAGVEARLSRLGFVENLTAVRDLHEAIRIDGESPERVGALARGYAQLGVLSEFQWHPAHKAFKARALLYAQRLVARDAPSPWGFWHRAFAESLVGMTGDARENLEQARMRVEGVKGAATPPDWVKLIDAYVANDLTRLKARNGPHVNLVGLLRLMAVEYPSKSSVTLRAAQDLVTLDPECYRAHDAMCRVGGVSNLHGATVVGPQELARSLPEKLNAVETLPPAVREALGKDADPTTIAGALARAGVSAAETGEPSWGVLAHLIRETQFVQVYRRLDFLRNALSVPTDEFLAEAGPQVAGHRFRPFLEGLANSSQDSVRLFTWFAERLDMTDSEATESGLIRLLVAHRLPKGQLVLGFAWQHADPIVRDVSMLIELLGTGYAPHLAKQLIAINPHSTFAMASLVEFDWESFKDKVPAWEKEAPDAPALLGALGKRYTTLKKYDEAQKLLARYIKFSPDAWAYEMLAANYKATGDRVRWKETLDDFLANVEDHGLDHARVRVQIANDFMEQKKWAEAKPYADDAAETWAAWAMLCAARCYEGMEDWDQAALWISRTSERYPQSSWLDWYRFCRRTGHGDLKAAIEWTEAYLDSIVDRPDLVRPLIVGYTYWSVGSPKKAIRSFDRAIETNPSEPMGVVHAALVADELGDMAKRDELLTLFCTKHKSEAPKSAELIEVFRGWLADGCKGKPDVAAAEHVIASSSPDGRGNLEFLAGRILAAHGEPEAGLAHLKRCADDPKTYEWLKYVAADAVSRSEKREKP